MESLISILFFTPSELLPEGGRMHRGFNNSFQDSWPNLYGILKSHAEKQKSEIKDFRINLTGHSMGGAIAKIAALCLNKKEDAEDVHVATFADPRVFDLTASEIYNDALQEKTIRVTHHRQDPVPAVLPGSFGYAHVGAQLRVPTPEGYSGIDYFHGIDGYHEAIKMMDESDFKSNNNVSLFYYPANANSGLIDEVNHGRYNKLFCLVDDFCRDIEKNFAGKLLPNGKKPTRTTEIEHSEIMTIILLYQQSPCKNFKTFYLHYLTLLYKSEFPKLPSYTRFVALKPRVLWHLAMLLHWLCGQSENTGISYIDTTPIAVCHAKRISKTKFLLELQN